MVGPYICKYVDCKLYDKKIKYNWHTIFNCDSTVKHTDYI